MGGTVIVPPCRIAKHIFEKFRYKILLIMFCDMTENMPLFFRGKGELDRHYTAS